MPGSLASGTPPSRLAPGSVPWSR